MHEVRYTSAALKTLRRLPRNTAELIRVRIGEVATDPAAARNVKRLKGRDGYRLRVGDWRVIFDVDRASGAVVIIVIEIGPRGEIYG